jgi:Putative transposase, YhgA-like
MVEMLVREFVPEALAAGLDFSQLQRVNAKFHIRRGSNRRREGDVIWRLPTRESTKPLYLLFEFQSRIDWWMPLRAQVYMGLLWQQVVDEFKLETGSRLPPLLTLVIYNGLKPWIAPTRIGDMISLPGESALWPWQPHVRHHVLDMSAFSGDDLAGRRSLAALLFRLERPLAPEELEKVRGEVSDWFRQHPDQVRLRALFGELVRQAFNALLIEVPQSINLLEMNMRSNLATIGERWKQEAMALGRAEGLEQGKAEGMELGKAEGKAQGMAEGKAQGKAEGRTEGKAEAKAEALVCLLVARFGALAPALRARIQRAELETLDRWFERAIAAPNVRSVFDSSR